MEKVVPFTSKYGKLREEGERMEKKLLETALKAAWYSKSKEYGKRALCAFEGCKEEAPSIHPIRDVFICPKHVKTKLAPLLSKV